MKLAVFGATGGVGTQLVKLALEQGHTVTAIVRNPARFSLPSHPALHLVTVPDLADTERVQAAISGSDAALSGVGPSGFRDVHAASVPTRHILTALRGAGVERFVAVSAAPIGPRPDGEGLLGRFMFAAIRKIASGIYDDLAVMERDIAATDLKWTVVRPPQLTNDPLGEYRTAFGTNVRNGHKASRAEVAHAMLALLADDRSIRQGVGVAR
ncbi:NAD(P)-dependent oxidoreductase [Actinophytocola sp.]|uniref:NAD(P)-dependent oxidoreductase n=1 Tax=Actinophytocola sp. TaxID=1872138 RepID=UPI002ED57530